ncbi:conjugative transfer protein MobI(A/C) [Alkalimarinus alittae]|uniref:Uncharacterized protein n=1 Tax=Alkalimarinus alittae TaxID=2961619 RepID=A0ABY6MX86_9ALTE|nr:conjugative transfer protein MobI(A/C) [Alkalimarinus alittae]UZE94412.1 hypothetical protein NKI27_09920 [Alkalimarinus alittae]
MADIIADEFWEKNEAHRNDKHKWEKGTIGVRIRRLNKWLHICWFKNKFYKHKGSQKMQLQDLPRNKNVMRYRPSLLPSPTSWEKQAFIEAEEQFESIRKAQSYLKEIDSIKLKYLKEIKHLTGEREMARCKEAIKKKNEAWSSIEIDSMRNYVDNADDDLIAAKIAAEEGCVA